MTPTTTPTPIPTPIPSPVKTSLKQILYLVGKSVCLPVFFREHGNSAKSLAHPVDRSENCNLGSCVTTWKTRV